MSTLPKPDFKQFNRDLEQPTTKKRFQQKPRNNNTKATERRLTKSNSAVVVVGEETGLFISADCRPVFTSKFVETRCSVFSAAQDGTAWNTNLNGFV